MTHDQSSQPKTREQSRGVVLLAWLLVSVPLIWGIWQTIKKAAVLFR